MASIDKKQVRKAYERYIAPFRKYRQEEYLSQLKARLEVLNETFIIPVLYQERKEFRWPTGADLLDLDHCIFGLTRTLRTKKLVTHNEAIRLVDEEWPQLHLVERLTKLLRAGRGHSSESPEMPESLDHLKWIRNVAKGHSPKADLSRRFLRDYKLLRQKKQKLSAINWAAYEQILLSRDGQKIFLQCGMEFPSPAMNCCVRYLEMERDYWLYNRDAGKWRAAESMREPLFAWVERADWHDSGLEEARKQRTKEGAKKRQRRHREKLVAKSVTSNGKAPPTNRWW